MVPLCSAYPVQQSGIMTSRTSGISNPTFFLLYIKYDFVYSSKSDRREDFLVVHKV